MRAAAVDRLAVAGAQHVDLAGVGEGLQGAVDGGQPDRVAAVLEQVVQVLRAAEVVDLVERRRDRGPLPGGPAAYRAAALVVTVASVDVSVLAALTCPPRAVSALVGCSTSGRRRRSRAGPCHRRTLASPVVASAGRAPAARGPRPGGAAAASGAASTLSDDEQRDGEQHDRGAGRHVA